MMVHEVIYFHRATHLVHLLQHFQNGCFLLVLNNFILSWCWLHLLMGFCLMGTFSRYGLQFYWSSNELKFTE
jgi:hypothetical protein